MTSPRAIDNLLSRSAFALAGAGRPGRELMAHLELAAAAGPAYVSARFREGRAFARASARIDADYYRRLWTSAAAEVGATVTDHPAGILSFQHGDRRTLTQRQWTTLDDVVTVRASLDKVLVNGLLRDVGVPTTSYVECRLGDLSPAVELLRRSGAVVVKPARGTGGGMGATAGVSTTSQLRRAAIIAARRSTTILVEPQVPGSVYRLLFLDGELLDVVRRDPPHVMGDGSSTVRELILAENRRRLAAGGDLGLQLITATLDCVYALAGQGLRLGSVASPGTRVRVRNVTNQSGPADSHTVSEPPADELVREARSSVQALGLRLAGVDVITADLNRPLAETGGALIEVNGGPGLHHHYLVSDPSRAVHVCDPVLRRALGLT